MVAPLPIPLADFVGNHTRRMTDPDDVEAISFVRAMDDLHSACQKLASPEIGYVEWLQMVVAVLVAGQCPGRPLTWTMTLCARRITSDIICSL